MTKRVKVDDHEALSPSERAAKRRVELAELVKIDRDDLDEMFVTQPMLLAEVGDQHAMAMSRRDRSDRKADEIFAMLDMRFRKGPDKLSETQIKMRITVHAEYKEAFDEYLRMKREADRWQALRDAMGDRSYMLKELGAKFRTEYHAESSSVRTSRETGADARVAEDNKEAAGRKRHGG